MQERER